MCFNQPCSFWLSFKPLKPNCLIDSCVMCFNQLFVTPSTSLELWNHWMNFAGGTLQAAHFGSFTCFLKPKFCNQLVVLRVTCVNRPLPMLSWLNSQPFKTELQFFWWCTSISTHVHSGSTASLKTKVFNGFAVTFDYSIPTILLWMLEFWNHMNGFTGDMLQPSQVGSTASFLKPQFHYQSMVLWVTPFCVNHHLLPLSGMCVSIIICSCWGFSCFLKPKVCKNLMVLRVTCIKQHLFGAPTTRLSKLNFRKCLWVTSI